MTKRCGSTPSADLSGLEHALAGQLVLEANHNALPSAPLPLHLHAADPLPCPRITADPLPPATPPGCRTRKPLPPPHAYPLPPPFYLPPPPNTKSPTPFYQHPPVQVARPPPSHLHHPPAVAPEGHLGLPVQVARNLATGLVPAHSNVVPSIVRPSGTEGRGRKGGG